MGDVLTGAIAIVKSNGNIIAKLKSWRFSENITRAGVQGMGTIYESEVPVVKYSGTLAVSKITVSFKDGIVPNAFRRNLSVVASQALGSKVASVEDNLVLDDTGVTVECYRKIADVIDPATGFIKPKVVPFIVCTPCFLEGNSLDISEAALSGQDQNFRVLNPPIYP